MNCFLERKFNFLFSIVTQVCQFCRFFLHFFYSLEKDRWKMYQEKKYLINHNQSFIKYVRTFLLYWIRMNILWKENLWIFNKTSRFVRIIKICNFTMVLSKTINTRRNSAFHLKSIQSFVLHKSCTVCGFSSMINITISCMFLIEFSHRKWNSSWSEIVFYLFL